MAKPKSKQKLEFDKDYIFNLIMPSGSAHEEEVPASDIREDVIAIVPEELTAQDSLSDLRTRLFMSPPAVQSAPSQGLVLVNIMEAIVLRRMESAFERFACCRCDKCKKDVALLALNNIPPHYVLADPENLEPHIIHASTKGVSDAIVKAIIQVKNNPSH